MSEKTDKAIAVLKRPRTTQGNSQSGVLERVEAVEHLILEFLSVLPALKGSTSTKGGKKK